MDAENIITDIFSNFFCGSDILDMKLFVFFLGTEQRNFMGIKT